MSSTFLSISIFSSRRRRCHCRCLLWLPFARCRNNRKLNRRRSHLDSLIIKPIISRKFGCLCVSALKCLPASLETRTQLDYTRLVTFCDPMISSLVDTRQGKDRMNHRPETYGSRRCACHSGALCRPPQVFVMLGPYITTGNVPQQQQQLGLAVILVHDDRCCFCCFCFHLCTPRGTKPT
jgi:hypothetical protein